MIKLQIRIKNIDDAINIVRQADKLNGDVDFTNGRVYVDAKSLLGVLSADFSEPCNIIILNNTLDNNTNAFVDAIKENIISMEVDNEKSKQF